MRGHADILLRLQQEPNREYKTSELVESLYSGEWRAIRHSLEFGSRQDQKAAQVRKTKLHRKALYHISQLVKEGILRVVRLESHGEKVFALAIPYASVESSKGTVKLQRHELSLPLIREELEEKKVFVFEPSMVLSRFESIYLSAERLDGLGQLLHFTEQALKITSDTLAVGELHNILGRYKQEDLREFIESLVLQTLDEAKSVCLLLNASFSGDRSLATIIAELAPSRIWCIIVADQAALRLASVHDTLAILQERIGKVAVHVRDIDEPAFFWGASGPYGVNPKSWSLIKSGATDLVVVSRTSIALDLERIRPDGANALKKIASKASHTLFTIAAQQRVQATGVSTISSMGVNPLLSLKHSSVSLRLWNYDWEKPTPPLKEFLSELEGELANNIMTYRSCGLALEPELQITSTFAKFSKELSSRSYRKWTVNKESDLTTSDFVLYQKFRREAISAFKGLDRLRVFRAGNPTSAQVASEMSALASAGFPFLCYEFKSLQGMKKLTEYLQ